jgi:hypothetical protein
MSRILSILRASAAIAALLALLGFAAPAWAQSYGATAIGMGGGRVGAGNAVDHPTQSRADDAAVRKCRETGAPGCRVVGRFWNGGCGWVTTGSKPGGVCWGKGPDSAVAMSECRSRGCKCRTPIGGCTRAP